MKKYEAKSAGRKQSLPPWVWVLIGVAGAAVLAVGGYAIYRATHKAAPELPSASDALSGLPTPQLPPGEGLPQASGNAQLPNGTPLPEADYPGAQLPNGTPLPEADYPGAELPDGTPLPQADAPPPPMGPSGTLYYAASVHRMDNNMRSTMAAELDKWNVDGSGLLGDLQLGVPEGMQQVVTIFRMYNDSNTSLQVTSQTCSLTYGGRTYRPSIFASGFDVYSGGDSYWDFTLHPGVTVEKYVVFDIPEGAHDVIPVLDPPGRPAAITVQRVAVEQLPAPSTPQQRGISP